MQSLETTQLTQTGKWHAYTSDILRGNILKLQLRKQNQQDLFKFLLDHYYDSLLSKQE